MVENGLPEDIVSLLIDPAARSRGRCDPRAACALWELATAWSVAEVLGGSFGVREPTPDSSGLDLDAVLASYVALNLVFDYAQQLSMRQPMIRAATSLIAALPSSCSLVQLRALLVLLLNSATPVRMLRHAGVSRAAPAAGDVAHGAGRAPPPAARYRHAARAADAGGMR